MSLKVGILKKLVSVVLATAMAVSGITTSVGAFRVPENASAELVTKVEKLNEKLKQVFDNSIRYKSYNAWRLYRRACHSYRRACKLYPRQSSDGEMTSDTDSTMLIGEFGDLQMSIKEFFVLPINNIKVAGVIEKLFDDFYTKEEELTNTLNVLEIEEEKIDLLEEQKKSKSYHTEENSYYDTMLNKKRMISEAEKKIKNFDKIKKLYYIVPKENKGIEINEEEEESEVFEEKLISFKEFHKKFIDMFDNIHIVGELMVDILENDDFNRNVLDGGRDISQDCRNKLDSKIKEYNRLLSDYSEIRKLLGIRGRAPRYLFDSLKKFNCKKISFEQATDFLKDDLSVMCAILELNPTIAHLRKYILDKKQKLSGLQKFIYVVKSVVSEMESSDNINGREKFISSEEFKDINKMFCEVYNDLKQLPIYNDKEEKDLLEKLFNLFSELIDMYCIHDEELSSDEFKNNVHAKAGEMRDVLELISKTEKV